MKSIPLTLPVFEPVVFRVYGEPLPFPKKDVVPIFGKRKRIVGHTLMPHDYRTRKNPITGKVEKYDKGYKQKWIDNVQRTAAEWMIRHGRKPFSKNHPVAMGCVFFMTKAKSCKLPLPSLDPDLDNFEYAVWNALKRTPKDKKGRPGPYPKGVCFYEDNQVVWRLHPSGILWADEQNPPGVVIKIVDAMGIIDEIAAGVEQVSEIT